MKHPKPKRPKLKTKRTATGRIMGRPFKNADDLIEDMPPLPRESGYDDTLLIVQACVNVGKRHAARAAAEIELKRGHVVSPETVRRRMRRIRAHADFRRNDMDPQ